MSKGIIWITRSLPAAQDTANLLAQKGYEGFVGPLIEILPPEQPPPAPTDGSLLVFTSKNAIQAFCQHLTRRDYSVVAVGDATANFAKSQGFEQVLSARGNSKDVTALILKKFDPGPLIHCCGETIRGQIVEDLERAGFSAQRHIYYRQEQVKHLPKLPQNLSHVLFFSPMAARVFSSLSPRKTALIALSMSPAIDRALRAVAFKRRQIASAPNLAAMITALDCSAAGGI